MSNKDISGTINYKSLTFYFHFNEQTLKMYPSKEQQDSVNQWGSKELVRGVYTLGNPILLEDDYLVGKSDEIGKTIIFIPKSKQITKSNSVIIIETQMYFVLPWNTNQISEINFFGPEIDAIYPCNNNITIAKSNENAGEFIITTANYETTTSDQKTFLYKERNIKVDFSISRIINFSTYEKPPLQMQSSLNFYFDKTDDYLFVAELSSLASKFISYLCYRNNIYFSKIQLVILTEQNIKSYGEIIYCQKKGDIEFNCIKDKRFISYDEFRGYEHVILNSLSSNTLYTTHIPSSYEQGRHINASTFILITAAFEWEFKNLYLEGITKKQSTIEAEEYVKNIIEDLKNSHTGKKKEIFRFLSKLVRSDSLDSKIIHTFNDLTDIASIFGKHIYSLNEETLLINEMANRISKQRNNFAHGNIDNEFIGLSLLDLIFLERLIYIMQLKRIGLCDLEIKKAINDLFKCNLMIKE